jgi:phosphate transport system protein
MTLQSRSVLDHDIQQIIEDIIKMTSLIDEGLGKAIAALETRDMKTAQYVINNDEKVNYLRYEIEAECLRVLATQNPMATDLRRVISAMHISNELERIGDHAAGIARLVTRMEDEDKIDSLHKLPKMAKRAREMLNESVQAFTKTDALAAEAMLHRDDKLDKQYNKLVRESLEEMRDDNKIRLATYLIWVGHNLERIGDRAINIAERVIFTSTGEYIEITQDL